MNNTATVEQVTNYAQALLAQVTIGVIVPLVILASLALAIWILLARAARTPGFRLADMLVDETGKASSSRLIAFGTWAMTSWALAVVVLGQPNLLVEALVTYLIFWSGGAVATAIARMKWGGPQQPGGPTP